MKMIHLNLGVLLALMERRENESRGRRRDCSFLGSERFIVILDCTSVPYSESGTAHCSLSEGTVGKAHIPKCSLWCATSTLSFVPVQNEEFLDLSSLFMSVSQV